MAIGINDLDFDDDEYGLESMNDTTTQDIEPIMTIPAYQPV